MCRQLRLRNLSGIILIDYINMTEKEHIESVISTLKKLIALDPVKTTFHDCTALNLIELTRQKIREPLDEQLKRLNAASDNTGWK
ncbi:MAG: ribonuclease E/G [Lachnospiraceae bacterium]|nr:ribonuclease E/G [Lachnospiraceae bacterium]